MIFMKIWGFLTAFLIFAFFSTTKVDAMDMAEQSTELTIESGVYENVLDNKENSQNIEYNIEFDNPVEVYAIDPLPVYYMNEDDYNTSGIATMSLNDTVYAGSYNSTALSLWQGLLLNNVGKDFVAYRRSQYEYVIIIGENFEQIGSVFSGRGMCYLLNTYGQSYSYTYYEDSFNIDADNYYIYTNVGGNYPTFETERGGINAQIQNVVLVALLMFNVFKWVFVGK